MTFDKNEIERCIVNLVSNAAKHTPSGGSITISIYENTTYVTIAVKDTGCGIDKKYHNNIFNRFYQVVDKEAETRGGRGLGLTITKSIVELHGGIITLESKINEGSTFYINLPNK